MKFAIPALLLLASTSVLIFSAGAEAAAACQMKKSKRFGGHPRIDLQVGDRKITILGWAHISPSEKHNKKVVSYLQSAFDAAKKKDCATAAENLTSLWLSEQTAFSEAKELLRDLRSVDREIGPTAMAVEYSPEMWAPRSKAVNSNANVIEYVVQQCPEETQNMAENVAVIYPGPEFIYELSRAGTLNVVPVEDESVRAGTLKFIDELFRLPELSLLMLNPKSRELTGALLSTIKDGMPFDDKDADAAIQAQGDNATGKLLAQTLKLYQSIIANNPRRNSKMADKILAGDGNYVYPVGASHVDDLGKQIYDRCLAGEIRAQKSTSYGTFEAPLATGSRR